MRFLVLSDTHGDVRTMLEAVDYIQALKPDAALFLGDVTADAYTLQRELDIPFTTVAGNCDAGTSRYPSTEVVEAEGVRIFLCHGHQYSVYDGPQRLIWAAQEKNCTVALYGHTHRQELIREQGVLVMNPGSLCRPRLCDPGLGILDVKDGQAKGLILPFFASGKNSGGFF